ncbi:unnamed protein product [Rhizophagus irregularis]|uniref:Uncharacterized protein n=1 Tax=Rhizophagus irregularis TaxID=588596 RepID=A0A916EK13_9GLOM|nr:unnamed protein product [Rhizophagus irregularis]
MKISDTFYKFTIVLTCAADGTKYSPICVFRGTELPYGEKVPDKDKAKFPTIDSIIKEIKADDANQRSRSQDDEFNSEYTIETETEEVNNNNEKTSENTNEGTVTEIRAMFDEYVFTETDQLEGTSAFVPLSPETMHPDHTQSSHIHPTLLRTDFIQSTSTTNRRHSNINSAQYFR